MNIKLLSVVFAFVQLSVLAQKKDKVLFEVNNKPTYVSEFKNLFKKSETSLNTNSFDEDLQLMVDYKLKLKAAAEEKIDTLESLKREYKTYKKEIVESFLKDDEALEELLKEAYERTVNLVKVRHLLIKAKGNDTLKAFEKIKMIKSKLDNGASFEKMVLKFSEGNDVQNRKGDLGTFGAFRMVYPFETGAYNTPVGEISDIVKTQFGYHLIKVDDKVKAGDKKRVAHIMSVGPDTIATPLKDKVYKKLLAGENFEELAKKYSSDKISGAQGGVLPSFYKGKYPKEFEDVAFSMTELNQISKPFKTSYGWHIVKNLGFESIGTYDEMKKELKKMVLRNGRKHVIDDKVYGSLEKEYAVTTVKKALKVFEGDRYKNLPKDSLQNTLFSIKNKDYSQQDFIKYIETKRSKAPLKIYKKFKREKLKEYLVTHLEDKNQELKSKLTTYKNGLVIFELMKKHVWDVPATEPEKVVAFYEQHKNEFKDKGATFEEVKGYVESKYQEKVQEEWLAGLRAKNEVKFKKKQVKKLRKTYK